MSIRLASSDGVVAAEGEAQTPVRGTRRKTSDRSALSTFIYGQPRASVRACARALSLVVVCAAE